MFCQPPGIYPVLGKKKKRSKSKRSRLTTSRADYFRIPRCKLPTSADLEWFCSVPNILSSAPARRPHVTQVWLSPPSQRRLHKSKSFIRFLLSTALKISLKSCFPLCSGLALTKIPGRKLQGFNFCLNLSFCPFCCISIPSPNPLGSSAGPERPH